MNDIPHDNLAYRFPVSMKGVLRRNGKVLLLKNERDEWELPGGKLELGELPAECLARELLEETGMKVAVARLIDVWVYDIAKDVHVLIVTHECHPADNGVPRISHEHRDMNWFSDAEIDRLKIPRGYVDSIAKSRRNAAAPHDF